MGNETGLLVSESLFQKIARGFHEINNGCLNWECRDSWEKKAVLEYSCTIQEIKLGLKLW